jgi:hypothetical protein
LLSPFLARIQSVLSLYLPRIHVLRLPSCYISSFSSSPAVLIVCCGCVLTWSEQPSHLYSCGITYLSLFASPFTSHLCRKRSILEPTAKGFITPLIQTRIAASAPTTAVTSASNSVLLHITRTTYSTVRTTAARVLTNC